MAFDKINNYANGDDNIEAMQLTMDKIYRGKLSISLTEMDTSTIPAIEAGSWADNNGALFEKDTGTESISTTDPKTSSTVADGTVYAYFVPGTGEVTAAFSATEPEWSASKQGWYGTATGVDMTNYRCFAKMTKSGSSYTDKMVVIGGSNDLNGRLFDPDEV